MSVPWVEKYRPRTLDAVLGHPQAVADLKKWADAWAKGAPGQRAAVLAGPPGCGKTSVAHALASHYGWELIELNASDARNAAAIDRVAGLGSLHQTFTAQGEFHSTKKGQRKLIILDEADNLYERSDSPSQDAADLSDRGGKRAIAETVLHTQHPIILIANDAYELLRGAGERMQRAVVRIPFRRLAGPTVKKVLQDIAAREGVVVKDAVLQALAERSHGDLRSALNDLEAISMGRARVDDLSGLDVGERNRTETAFNAVASIFRSGALDRAVEAARSLDEPPEFLLAWLDENLPAEFRHPGDLERAYHWLSRADIMLGRTLRRQHFALWGYATELMAGGVSATRVRPAGPLPRYEFPTWIRRMASSKSGRGVRARLAAKLGAGYHLSTRKVLADVLPLLRLACQRSQRLAEAAALQHDLDEDEIRFLLEDAPDAYVEEVLAHVERRRAQGPSRQDELDLHEESPPKPQPVPSGRTRGATLGEF